jgi:hypothetical protein
MDKLDVLASSRVSLHRKPQPAGIDCALELGAQRFQVMLGASYLEVNSAEAWQFTLL